MQETKSMYYEKIIHFYNTTNLSLSLSLTHSTCIYVCTKRQHFSSLTSERPYKSETKISTRCNGCHFLAINVNWYTHNLVTNCRKKSGHRRVKVWKSLISIKNKLTSVSKFNAQTADIHIVLAIQKQTSELRMSAGKAHTNRLTVKILSHTLILVNDARTKMQRKERKKRK